MLNNIIIKCAISPPLRIPPRILLNIIHNFPGIIPKHINIFLAPAVPTLEKYRDITLIKHLASELNGFLDNVGKYCQDVSRASYGKYLM